MTANSTRVGALASWVVAGLALACSESGDGSGEGGATGTVTEPWTSYCVATFSEDHQVMDVFEDPLFTARAGEQYLVGYYGERNGQDTAELMYMTDLGPYDLEFTAPLGSRDFPFTTNCSFDGENRYNAVFADITLYESDALTTPLCDLSAGTVVPVGQTGSGYGLVGSGFGGDATYEVMLGAMSQECGGATTGYVRVPETRVLGIYTNLVPLGVVVAAE